MTRNEPALGATDTLLAQLRDIRLNHQRLQDVMDKLEDCFCPGREEEMIFLIGPTGIGKTTVLQKLVHERVTSVDKENVGRLIPAIYVRADAAQANESPFVTLYDDCLQQLREPYVEGTLTVEEPASGKVPYAFPVPAHINRGTVHTRYKFRFRNTALDRATELVGIDEATHLITGGRGDVNAVADELKTLVQGMPFRLLLAGSSDLMRLRFATAQVARRCRWIYFLPYDPDVDVDVEAFQDFLHSFFDEVPFKHSLEATGELTRDILLACFGDIGHFVRAARDTAQQHFRKGVAFNARSLLSNMPSRLDRDIFEREIGIIKALKDENLPLALELGFLPATVSASPVSDPTGSAGQRRAKGRKGPRQPNKRPSRQRVGRRGLGRDPVNR